MTNVQLVQKIASFSPPIKQEIIDYIEFLESKYKKKNRGLPKNSKKDAEIINRRATRLNAEAMDVLAYQVKI